MGQGDAELTRRVCAEHGAWYACAPDPERTSYALYGLGYSTLTDIVRSRQVARAAHRAGAKGHAQHLRRTFAGSSDWLQLPGACVIDRGGTVRHIHRGRDVGDVVLADELLTQLRSM